jgi:putative peptidoglycan lipid II flippase
VTSPRVRGALFLVYAVALIVATHWPQLRLEEGPVPRPDLFIHFGAFGTLAFLLCLTGWCGPMGGPRTIFRALLVCLPWCVIDESSQAIEGLGRVVSLDDLLANWGGVVIGLALTVPAGALWRRRSKAPPEPSEAEVAPPKPQPGFVGHARVFAGVTMVSRVFGLSRDALCAFIFGAGPVWSAFVTAFVLPNALRRLFGEGALSAAFVPRYTKLIEEDPERGERLAAATVLGVGGVVSVLAALVLAVLYPLFAVQLGSDNTRLVLALTMLMLPFMPSVCLTALLGGVLHTHGRFAAPAAMPILLNAWMIAGVCLAHFVLRLDERTTALVLAGTVGVAGMTQTAWCAVEVGGLVRWRHAAAGARAAWDETRRELSALLRRMGPVALGLGATQLGLLIDGLIAGWPVAIGPTIAGLDYPLDTASASILYYGQRLYQLPIGVFAVALATAMLPALSRAAGDAAAFRAVLSRGLRTGVFVGAPAATGLAAVALPLVWTIYGGAPASGETVAAPPAGSFTGDDAMRVSLVLAAYAPAIVFAAVSHALTRSFYASDDTRGPMLVGIVSVACNVVLNMLLIWPLGEAGLAVSTSLCAFGQAVALWFVAKRRLPDVAEGVLLPGAKRSIAMSAAAAVGMGAAVWIVLDGAGATIRDALGGGRLGAAGTLAAGIALGAALYGGVALVQRRSELRWVLTRGH